MKEAADVTSDDVGAAGLLGAGTLVAASPTTKGRLLGFKRVYHGTTPENKKSILREGFKKSHGGRGGASEAVGSSSYMRESAGKVHVTRLRPVAKAFTAFADKDISDSLRRAMTGGKPFTMGEKIKLIKKLNPLSSSGVVTADMPIGQFDRFEIDPDMVPIEIRRKYPNLVKNIAARGAEDIDPVYVHNLSPSRYLKRLGAHVKALPEYVKKHPGRFASGVGLGALGAGGVILGGRHFVKKYGPNAEKKASAVSDVSNAIRELENDTDPEMLAGRLIESGRGRVLKPIVESSAVRPSLLKLRNEYRNIIGEKPGD
jgi:hypothetical protein